MYSLRIIAQIARLLHSGELKPEDLDEQMISGYADEIYTEAQNAYTGSFSATSVVAPDEVMLEAMRKNIFVFSGFKTYTELSEWSSRLLDDAGQVKPFSQFLKEVRIVNRTYREAYLKAEYNHAIASSQSIATYQQYSAETDTIPMWEMDVVLDDRTRHERFDGIRRRFDDPIWKTLWPPLAWGCRCRVRQSLETEPSNHSLANLPPLDPMFANNPGIDGVIFPSSHPYFEFAQNKARGLRKKIEGIYDKANAK